MEAHGNYFFVTIHGSYFCGGEGARGTGSRLQGCTLHGISLRHTASRRGGGKKSPMLCNMDTRNGHHGGHGKQASKLAWAS